MPMDALSIKNLNVVLGAQQVLRDVTFEIKKGELAAVIGPNGSGKTTLFRAILGLIPYSGEIKVLGKPAAQALDKIGYVPQHFDFDRSVPITVGEFLSFSEPKIKGKSQESICREVRVDVLHDKLLGELSGGQLQRVLIANALFKNPSILLLDEPSAGIDIEGAQAFYELVEHLNSEHGVTVLLISHEVSFVHRLADRVICVNKDLICDGVPEKVLDQATLKKLYGSDITGHIH